MALRVPTITGSVVDLVWEPARPVTVEEVNAAVKAAANETIFIQKIQLFLVMLLVKHVEHYLMHNAPKLWKLMVNNLLKLSLGTIMK